MNTYVTLACLLAVVGLSHGSAIGYGGYGLGLGSGYGSVIVAPAAVSTANQWRAAPIPVVRSIITAPIIRTVVPVAPVVKTISPIGLGWNGLGLNGLGWNGVGLNGLGGWGHGIH